MNEQDTMQSGSLLGAAPLLDQEVGTVKWAPIRNAVTVGARTADYYVEPQDDRPREHDDPAHPAAPTRESDAHADHGHSHTVRTVERAAPQFAPYAHGPGAPLRIGVGGPVGAGKTALIYRICQMLAPSLAIGVVTNDIYTREDAAFLAQHSALPAARVIGVETGGCPHAAVRDDVSANLDAIDDLLRASPDLQIVLLESGGDNLSATFSPDLVERTIYVIDVAAGDKIPRKRGLGMIQADLLIVNKIDLAPYVGANLEVMARDAAAVRGTRPTLFTNLQNGSGLDEAVSHIRSWLVETGREVLGRLEDTGTVTGTLPRWT